MGHEALLGWLRAAGEATRLRLLLLCARGELTVSELTQILGQSQPRVSRHLKVLCDAGLLERVREGSSVFYGVTQSGKAAQGVRAILDLADGSDARLGRFEDRLAGVVAQRREAAARYFDRNAAQWDAIRSLHIDEAEVERAMIGLLPRSGQGDLLDIGTGTGRILLLLAAHVRRALGVDLSREMLAIARANLDHPGFGHCDVRKGDMYDLPVAAGSADIVTIHQVLHFADRPADVIAEAARVLRPGGVLLVADFAPHQLEYLRDQHAHRRLGFADQHVRDWFLRAGLDPDEIVHLPGKPLTVSLWRARRPAASRAGQAEAA
ncbi:MAG: ArsR/SmtB family transcription factor [Alphaproteobacteria bacterium]